MAVIICDDDTMTPDELSAYLDGRRMYREGECFFTVCERYPYRGKRDAVKQAAEMGWFDAHDRVTLEERLEATRNGERV